MKKLTKEEKKIILKAANAVASPRFVGPFTCNELRYAGASCDLVSRYQDFFYPESSMRTAWGEALIEGQRPGAEELRRQGRILLLLLFREAAGDV